MTGVVVSMRSIARTLISDRVRGELKVSQVCEDSELLAILQAPPQATTFEELQALQGGQATRRPDAVACCTHAGGL